MPHGSWLMCNTGLWCTDTFRLNRRRWEAPKCRESWSPELSGGSDVTSHPIPNTHVINSLSHPTHLFLKFPCGFCTQTQHRQNSVNWKHITIQFITGCILFNLKILSLDSPPSLPHASMCYDCQLHLTCVFFFSIPPPLGTSSLRQMHFFLYKDVLPPIYLTVVQLKVKMENRTLEK